jgi:hypothetical protein
MPTTTATLGLTKPDLNQTGWGTLVNTDLDVIDAAIAARPIPSPTTPEQLASASILTLDFSSAKSKTKVITLTSSVTTCTAVNMTDGIEVTVCIKAGVGGFGFVFPSNFVNAVAISTANANNGSGLVLQQRWRYDAGDLNWYIVTPLIY